MVQLTFEFLAFPWMLEMLDDWRKHERGSLPGPIELAIIIYVTSKMSFFYDPNLLNREINFVKLPKIYPHTVFFSAFIAE